MKNIFSFPLLIIIFGIIWMLFPPINGCKPEGKEPSIKIVGVTFHASYDSLLDDTEMPGAFFAAWHVRDSLTDYHKGTIHWTNDTTPYLLFKFTGTRFEIYGMKDKHLGIMKITYDHKDTLIDNYSENRLDTSGVLFASPRLEWGDHYVDIRNTGKKNEVATNTHLIIDAVRVIEDVPVIVQKEKYE